MQTEIAPGGHPAMLPGETHLLGTRILDCPFNILLEK